MLKNSIVTTVNSIKLMIILAGFSILWAPPSLAQTQNTLPEKPFSSRNDVQRFIETMSTKHGFDKKTLSNHFGKFSTNRKILQAMDKPYEALPWYRYRERLVTKERVKEGILFWNKHAALLKKAEKTFGVPAEMIVAILGIETYYGQKAGTYPVLQSLSTLAFDYPRRADYFKGELEQFLLLVKEENIDPINTVGSYCGAMGAPQFMPSSYRRFAIDFENKGQRDLMHGMADTIASVANYFKSNGWQPKEAVAEKAKISGTRYQSLSTRKGKSAQPNLTVKELAKYNVKPQNTALFRNKTKKVKFIALEGSGNKIEPWLGYNNFYVITRYNNSTNYAMAVYQLSQQLRANRRG